jgi:hypothetical protein
MTVMSSDGSATVGQAIDALGFGKFQLALSFMVGFANIADAMEMMILSVLSPALHCHWRIDQWQQATLTTVVFLGESQLFVCFGMACEDNRIPTHMICVRRQPIPR